MSPELPQTSTTPSGCKNKINKYCLLQTKGPPNIKNRTKQKIKMLESRSACSTETDFISVYQPWK